MKTLSLSSLIMLVLISTAQITFANDGKYMDAMQKNIKVVYTSDSIAELQQAVNTLERIAAAEKTKWEPFYYASFGYVMMSNNEKEGAKKDVYLDQAMKAMNKAKALVPNESEVVALEGFIYMMMVTVDPASRGRQYSGLALQSFGKAVELNPENPRALGLLAQMQFGMAQFFGSPATEACATNSKALEKFQSYKSENPLAPQWGKGMVENMVEKCK